MTREEYRQLEVLLSKAVLTAIVNKEQDDIINVLDKALNAIENTYIWPDDLSTL